MRLTGLSRAHVALIAAFTVAAPAAFAAPAGAITRAGAVRIAKRALKPRSEPGPVIVFALHRALRAGARVGEQHDPGGGTVLPRAAFLFWEDLAPYARFAHFSRLVLVDARTGRVTRRTLSFQPLVNGRPPAFLSTVGAYNVSTYRIYSDERRASRRRARHRAIGQTAASPVATFPGRSSTCVVVFANREDKKFKGDIDQAHALAVRLGGTAYDVMFDPLLETAGDALERTLATTESRGCRAAVLLLIGDGWPADGSGITDHGKPIDSSPDPRVSVAADGYPNPSWVSAGDVRDALAKHPNLQVAAGVISCFGGRWTPGALGNPPNLLGTFASSAADQFTEGYHPVKWKFPASKQVNGRYIKLKPSRSVTVPVDTHGASGYMYSLAQHLPAALASAGGKLIPALQAVQPFFGSEAVAVKGGWNTPKLQTTGVEQTPPPASEDVTGQILPPQGSTSCTPLDAAYQRCEVPAGQVLLDISLSFEPKGGSSVTIAPLGITVTDPKTLPSTRNPAFHNVLAFVAPGTRVTMTAKPGAGRYFDGWQSVAGLGEQCVPPGLDTDGALTCGPVTVEAVPGGPYFWMVGGALFYDCPPNAAQVTADPIARDCH